MIRDGARQCPEICADVVSSIQPTLGPAPLGLFLYGSSVTGGFEVRRNNLDHVAVMARGPVNDDLPPPISMHEAIVTRFPAWVNRVEVSCVSLPAPQTFCDMRHRVAAISHGEPLNLRQVGVDWLLN